MISGHSFLFALAVVATFGVLAIAQDITTGMRGHWRLVETSGTTATDTTSTSQNGTYTGGVSLATSTAVPFCGALPANFDGSNDYVTIANHADLQPTSALTIVGWIRGDTWGTGSDVDPILRKGEANPNNYQLAIINGKVELDLDANDGAGVRGNTTLVTGQWYHVAATWNGSEVRIYVNGVLDNTPASRTGTIGTDTRPAYIGGRSGADLADGGIYDVRLYNRALTAAEISTLYNQTGLIAHWKLNQTSGTTATDSSPHLNNGTYTGGVTLNATGPYPGAAHIAASFDGTNDYVNTSNDYLYDITGPITVGAWIKVNAFTVSSQAIVTKGNTAWRLQRNGTTNQLQFACNGLSDTSVNSTSDINDGRWHHVVGRYNGSALAIYIDGVLEASDTSTGTVSINNNNVQVGENAGSTGKYWIGSIHDVRVYSVALSAAKVAELYGLIGYWKLNQTTGTTASDSSPFASNGTVSGTANWSTRCNGTGVFDFNGSTNYVTVPNASHLQPTSAMTIAGWVKGDSWGSGSDVDVVLRKGEGNPNNYQLAIADGKVAMYLDDSDGVGIRGNTTLTAGEWYHVAATWDGSTVKLFVNGVLDNTPAARTGTIATDTRPVYIGGRSGTDLFDGMLYDVRFYNRAMYDADVAELYGLVGHWKLDETSGTTASDSSGTGRTGTVTGAATWTAGSIDNALELNGATKVTVTGLMNYPRNVSLAAWADLTTADTGGSEVVSIGDCCALRLDDGTVARAFFYNGSTTVALTPTQTFAGTGWHHFAVVFNDDSNTFELYVDGVLSTSTTTASSISYGGQGTNTLIGCHGNGQTTRDFTGKLDDVRIYNRAICPTEVQALFDAGSGSSFGGVQIIKWVEIQ